MGERRKNLFTKNNFFLNNKYNYLLNHICDNFNFCSKIIIICKKKDREFIKYKNISNIKFIHLTSSKNQIDTILKIKDKIICKNPLLILNSDAYFNFEDNISKLKNNLIKKEIIFFGIKDYINNQINFDKDTLKISNKRIASIKIKSGIPDNKRIFISAGLYYFKNFNIFNELCFIFLRKNKINNKSLQIAHLLKYALPHKKLNYNFVNNFVKCK